MGPDTEVSARHRLTILASRLEVISSSEAMAMHGCSAPLAPGKLLSRLPFLHGFGSIQAVGHRLQRLGDGLRANVQCQPEEGD